MTTYNYSHIFKIAVPLVLGLVIQVLVGMTDTAFLGRVGEIELGASAIAGILYLLIFMICQGFCVGAQIIMARRNGEKNYQKTAPVFYQSLNFIFLFSLFSISFLFYFSADILRHIVASPAVLDAVIVYLLPRSLGFFFSGARSCFRSFFVAITDTKQLLYSAVILLISNFIFDYWLIFGGFGIEPLGLKGAAIASVLAEGTAVAYLAGYALTRIDLRKYGFNKYLLWSQPLFHEIIILSGWVILQNLLNWGLWLYFFIEIEKISSSALAVSNILRSLSSIPFVLANGLAIVTSSLVSNLVGADKQPEIMPTTFRIFKFGFFPYYGCFAAMALWPRLFLQIYTDNSVLIEQAFAPFYTMLVTYVLALPGMIYFYAIYGIGRTKAALMIEILCSVAYFAEIRIIVGILKAELVWCWMSEFGYYIVLFAASYIYMRRKGLCSKTV